MRLCIVLALALLAGLASANDGSGYMAAGGAVGLIKGQHPTVRMVDEKLHIKLPEGKVRVEYLFRNEGPAAKVLMAFPEEGYMMSKGADVIKRPGGTLFSYFHTWVDGKRAKVTRRPGDFGDNENKAHFGYGHWWVKEVSFAKNQTRRVVNEYQGGLGWGGIYGERSFKYTLTTGATWKGGKIGKLQITLDTRGLKGKSLLSLWFNGKTLDLKPGIWQFGGRDYVPQALDLDFSWYEGFGNINANGEALISRLYENRPWSEVTPSKVGDRVFVPAQMLRAIGGISVKRSGNRIVLTRNQKTLVVDPRWKGSYMVKGQSLLPLREVVEGFGGKFWWKNGTAYVKL